MGYAIDVAREVIALSTARMRLRWSAASVEGRAILVNIAGIRIVAMVALRLMPILLKWGQTLLLATMSSFDMGRTSIERLLALLLVLLVAWGAGFEAVVGAVGVNSIISTMYMRSDHHEVVVLR